MTSDRDFLLIELQRMVRYIKQAKTEDDLDLQYLLNWIDDLIALNRRLEETKP